MKPYTNCMEVREDFSALLDDELSPEEREQIEGHLSECAECLRELDALRQVDIAYGGLSRVKAPEDFEEGVREAIRPRPLRFPLLTGPGALRWMRPVVAVAALFLIAFAGVVAYRQSEPERFQIANLVEEEAADSFVEGNATAAAPAAASELRRLRSPEDALAAEPPREAGLDDARDALAADADGAWQRLTRQRADVPGVKDNEALVFFSEQEAKPKDAQKKAEASLGRTNELGGVGGASPRMQQAETPARQSREVSGDVASEEKLDDLKSLGYIRDSNAERSLSAPQALSLGEALKERDEVLGAPPGEFSDDAELQLERGDRLGKGLARSEGIRGRRMTADSIEATVNRAIEEGRPVKSTQIRRSYTIARDGSWIEKGYKGEKTQLLKRGSKELDGLTVLDPSIKKLVRRPARVVFRVEGKWYVLEKAEER